MSAIEADAPSGPLPEEEAALFAQERGMDIGTSALENMEAPEEPKGDLPPMEDLVQRIPAPVRALLDELFRARFVTVKRIPKAALKS